MKRIDIEELLTELSGIEDKRRPWGNLRHKLTDILFIILCAIMCGMEDIDGITIFGVERQEWLRKYIKMKNGAPSYATYERILRMMEPKEIEKLKNVLPGKCKSLLVTRKSYSKNWGNSSDDDVEDYDYDLQYKNDKPLCEAEDDFVRFLRDNLQ